MSIVLDGTTGITSTGITETSDGNVGVGVTPSAWGGGYKALQTTGPSMWGSSAVGHWTLNNYFDGSNYRYIADGAATDYYQLSGAHVWRTAPSGTAGNTISLTERVRIDSDGLKFNGDTSAANALDDYEEGTWTPEFLSLYGTMQTVNYGLRVGKYTKIGNVVHADFVVSWASTSGTGSGLLALSMPFAPYGNGYAHNGFGGVSYAAGLPTTAHLYGDSGSTRAVLIKANGTANSYYSPAEISSGAGQIMGRFIFHTT